MTVPVLTGAFLLLLKIVILLKGWGIEVKSPVKVRVRRKTDENKKPFTVPTVNVYELGRQSMERVLNQIRDSIIVMTFFQGADNTFKFLFSGFGEDEFAMLLIILNSHPQLYEFFKATVVNTELYRIDDNEAIKYSKAMVEHLKK